MSLNKAAVGRVQRREHFRESRRKTFVFASKKRFRQPRRTENLAEHGEKLAINMKRVVPKLVQNFMQRHAPVGNFLSAVSTKLSLKLAQRMTTIFTVLILNIGSVKFSVRMFHRCKMQLSR